MSENPMWRRYLRFWGPDVEADLRDELEFHIEMRTRELIEAGWSPSEARAEALRLFGSDRAVRQECLKIGKRKVRAARRAAFLSGVGQDLRHAFRMLVAQPGFTAVVVLSLGLGIGANTAIFSLIKAVLLERLPVDDPEELVLFRWVAGSGEDWVNYRDPNPRLDGHVGWMRKTDSGRQTSVSFSYSSFLHFLESEGPLSDTFAFATLRRLNVNLDRAEVSDGLLVSGGYFTGLGVSAHLGRLITEEDDRASADPVTVVSYNFWRSRFGLDPSILGRTVDLNGNPFTIVGVAPAGFTGTSQVGSDPSFYVPLALQSSVMSRRDLLGNPRYWWLQIMGRLETGVQMELAESILGSVLKQGIESDFGLADSPESDGPIPHLVLSAGGRGLDGVRQELVEPLAIAQAITALILLIACANAATLLTARADTRRREMAARLALGASRRRLVCQMLIEILPLAAMGGGLGLVLAQWGSDALIHLVQGTNLFTLELKPDMMILGFTLLASLVTGLVFGVVPALRTSKVELIPALKGGERGTVSRSHLVFGRTMVVAQVALSLILLVAAGLLLGTLRNLEAVDLGFSGEGVLTFRIDPTLNGYEDERLAALYDRLLEQFDALPGVDSASMTLFSPVSGRGFWRDVQLPEGGTLQVYYTVIDSRFLETLRIPLILGRRLSFRDDLGAPKVALVNETFARKAFDGENPIGRRFQFVGQSAGDGFEIVGVFRDGKSVTLRRDVQASVYLPYQQNPEELWAMTFLLLSDQSPESLLGPVRECVRRIDPNLSIFDTKTLTGQIDESMAQERHFARLTSLGGGLALLLASIGLYGTLSYSVSRREREIGIRMALGAGGLDILRSAMREMFLVGLGVVLGLAGAWAVTRWLSSLLFQLTPTDPLILTLATLIMVAAAAVAVFLPARRASRIDPNAILRVE